MMKKYCRMYFIIIAAFLAFSFLNSKGVYFIFYPCAICGMIPVSLLSYDEHHHWTQYSETLPYTRTQIVSSKYIIGLIIQGVLISVTGISQAIRMCITNSFAGADFFAIIMLLIISATVTSAFTMPFIFKFGIEKGRIAYYFTIGFICAMSFLLSSELFDSIKNIDVNIILTGLAVLGIALYVISWCLSVAFYKKREL